MAAMLDMVDIAELKKLVIMGLNWAMLAGSCLMKLPQINNILKAGSVVGLSETFVINDCMAGLLFVYYNVLSGHPFMSWGENVIVGLQNAIIVLLYWHYSPQLSKAPRFLGAAAFVLGSIAVLIFGLPNAAVSALGAAPIVLGNGSKVPQIWKNMVQKHTGTMAAVSDPQRLTV
ncbi:Mpdu1 [Symbiodinium pilosum]|uniref:Mpdu1 protein n=1 Tax=Symbiodinium pilosum TaxID=2952 RepID=A0A812IZV3_SYMPI|nr:Mpdu1 [Symbiodinium pilosum]